MDSHPAREILGYEPEKTLAESIREYGAWWREIHGAAGADSRKETHGSEKLYALEKPGKVKAVKLYKCGYCVNNMGLVFRGMKWEKRRFPARAALIRHKELGNILYDTGYSEEIFGGGPVLWLYRLLNPVCLEKGKIISEQLQKDHIPLESMKTILLSHAHPDHIGGLSRFSGYELVAFHETLDALNRPRIRNLVFPNLLPPQGTILRQQKPTNRLTDHFLCEYFEEVYDLFGDGSIIGVRLDGHSRGQMGLWIPDVSLFLAADACWGSDLIQETRRMRLLPRLIQNDFSAYEDSLERICRVKRDYPQIRVVFTHQKGV